MSVTHLREIYQIKIEVLETDPLIWRRLHLLSTIQLNELHKIIQTVMGWENYHMHEFIADDGFRYREPWDDDSEGIIDESKIKLKELLSEARKTILYNYDFGDDWMHKLTLEKVLPYDPKKQYPVCTAGARACPPEDSGGISGYERLLRIASDSKHKEHEEILEWLGNDFDPEYFNITLVNAELVLLLK